MTRQRFDCFKRKSVSLLLIAFILGAAACAAPEPLPVKSEPIEPDKAAYSVFIYVCGSDLETKHGAATKNIQEMLDADCGQDINLVLQTGGAKKWRSFDISPTNIQRYEMKDGTLKLLQSLPNDSMGKAATLADFLCYGIQNYPAEKYAVIIWDHGGGSISGVAFDEQFSYDALTLSELKEAFGKAADTTEQKLELIGLDACLMATVETAQTLAPFGNYMVASQEICPTTGWNYTAIVESLHKKPAQGGDDLGRTICDSYFEKCLTQDKDQTATLSLIDLHQIPVLTACFESFSKKMEDDQIGLYDVTNGIENSLGYGGLTKHEGHSNLFDLGCFADNMEAADVCAAVNKAVIYQRAGDQRAQATGLSVYYPEAFDKNELAQYANAFPDSKYAAFLTASYSGIPKDTVELLDAGTAADNGGLSMRLSQKSIQYVSTVEFELIKDEGGGQLVKLGMDNNLHDDWAAGLFTSHFEGYWIALDENMLQSHPVDETENSLIFSAPILLNGASTNLRFAFVFEQPSENPYDALEGHYDILGTWSGLDQETGMSKADMIPVQEGDELTILHEDPSGHLEAGSTVIYQNSSRIHDRPLSEGTYRYRFIVTDIFGRTYASNTAIFNVKLTADGKRSLCELVRIESSPQS